MDSITERELMVATFPQHLSDKPILKMTQSELDARVIIATDLFEEGKINKPEMFRIEVDALLGVNSGELKIREDIKK